LFLLVLLLGTVATVAAVAPDDYLGDAAIYTGVPSQRPTPNILLLIDTSRSTLNRAPGQGYDATQSYSSSIGYDNNQIYFGDNAGEFKLNNNLGTVTLTDDGSNPYVACTTTYTIPHPTIDGQTITKTVDVNSIMSVNGTYSGAGSSQFPNLSTAGACATASKGDTYATGNYLNYINSTAVVDADSIIIEHTYNKCTTVKIKGQLVTTCLDVAENFILTAELLNAPVTAEPGVGSNWSLYWSTTTEGPTYPKVAGIWNGADGWVAGTNYYLPASSTAKTQREAFFEALKPVISGASPNVNFGFLTYNPNNQGAVLGYPITFFGADPSALITALPRGNTTDGSFAGPGVINSGPNRPQSEALYDAGFYFMRNNGLFTPKYIKTDGSNPNTQSINLTAAQQVPSSIANLCGYNHIILLTNGLPNQDTSTPNLGDWDRDQYANEAVYGAGAHYLDDIAYYLHNVVDINGDGKPGDVTIHTVLAFQTEDELIKNTAEDGGGLFYNVADTNGLTKALQDILANIVSESDTAFVAPVVPASSTNRTISSNKVYLGLFKPQTNAPWHGNLKKYTVSSKNELLDVHGNRATDADGDFVYSQSYWGTGSVAGVTKIFGAEGARNVVPASYDPDATSTDPTSPSHRVVDPNGGDGGIVDAGGVGGTLQVRDLTTNPRKIYTYLTPANSFVASANSNLTAAQNAFSPANAGNISFASTLGVASALEEDKLVNYMHGYDAYGTTPTAKRNWIFGDILHSKPLVFNYSNYASSVESTCTDFSDMTVAFNSTVVYVGANDGMLHAFRDCDGQELWSFIPPSLLKDLKNLPEPGHEYYVDAPSSAYVHDFNNNGTIETGDKVILVFGLRRGGGNAYLTASDPRGSYVALDVTDPVAPKFLFEIDNATSADFSEMGETWSQPRLHKIMDGTIEKLVFFIGAGYDNNEDRRWGNTQGFPTSVVHSPVDPTTDTDTSVQTNDGEPGVSNAGMTSNSGGAQLNPKGRGLYVVELATLNKDGNGDYSPDFTYAGRFVWKYTYADDTANMRYSIPSDLAVLDWDGDGFADRVYGGDTGGQMWRFDLPIDRITTPSAPNGNSSMWTGRIIFKANPGFTGSVDADGNVTNTTDSSNGKKIFYRPAVARYGSNAILYFGTGDREHPLNLASADRMYMLFDRGQGAVSDDVSTLLFDETTIITETNLVDVTENELQNGTTTQVLGVLDELYDVNNFGWYIRLENSGEKMLAPPVVFFGQVFYTTYAPLVGAVAGCEVGNLGLSRLYHLDFRTGEAVFDYDKTNNSDDTTGNDRAAGKNGEVLKKTDRVRTLGEGIPSGIVTLIDASGQVTMMISASNRVGTYQAPDAKLITPVYWMQWND
jgi:type IV pilus assembly protein PilY1